MNRLPRSTPWILFALATAFCVAIFHQRLIPVIPTVSAAVAGAQNQAPPSQGQDPAAANVAPSGPSYTTEAPPAPSQSAAPGQPPAESEQPTETATEPPPPLPVYAQPPPPADGYIWTPGYWAWGPAGYYWVPGAWVEPPYMGALWTPGYWGFYGGRYSFYPGYWGLHIGFYGGINYGFGYVGFGYEGGYWNSGRFFYNSVYNHLNTRVVHNVYRYNAGNRARGVSRTSFNGGSRGVQVRPRPSEVAASPRANCSAHEHAGAARAELLRDSRTACGPKSRKACHGSHQPTAFGRPQREAYDESGGKRRSVRPHHLRVLLSGRACAPQDVTRLRCEAHLCRSR